MVLILSSLAIPVQYICVKMRNYLASSWKACPSVQFSWKVAPTLCVTNCPNLSLFCMHFCRASFFSMELFSLSSFLTTSIHLVMCCLCWSKVFCCVDNWCRSSSFVLFSSSIFRFRASRSEDACVSNSCILWHVSSVCNMHATKRQLLVCIATSMDDVHFLPVLIC